MLGIEVYRWKFCFWWVLICSFLLYCCRCLCILCKLLLIMMLLVFILLLCVCSIIMFGVLWCMWIQRLWVCVWCMVLVMIFWVQCSRMCVCLGFFMFSGFLMFRWMFSDGICLVSGCRVVVRLMVLLLCSWLIVLCMLVSSSLVRVWVWCICFWVWFLVMWLVIFRFRLSVVRWWLSRLCSLCEMWVCLLMCVFLVSSMWVVCSLVLSWCCFLWVLVCCWVIRLVMKMNMEKLLYSSDCIIVLNSENGRNRQQIGVMVSWFSSSQIMFICVGSIYGIILVVIIIRMLFRFELLRKFILRVDMVSRIRIVWLYYVEWLLWCRLWVSYRQFLLNVRQVMNSSMVNRFILLLWWIRVLYWEYISGRLSMIQVNRLVSCSIWVWLRYFNMDVFQVEFVFLYLDISYGCWVVGGCYLCNNLVQGFLMG